MECKGSFLPPVEKRDIVLIETLWNVKIILALFILCASGINRNIMECKDPSLSWKEPSYQY